MHKSFKYIKAYTLIEITLVMLILGILTALTLPNFYKLIEQGAARAAEQNVLTIYLAQKQYYFKHGYYCGTSFLSPSALDCAASLNNLNSNLSLNMVDNYYFYVCQIRNDAYGDSGNLIFPSFTCSAIRNNASMSPEIMFRVNSISSTPPAICTVSAANPSCLWDGFSTIPNFNQLVCRDSGEGFCPP